MVKVKSGPTSISCSCSVICSSMSSMDTWVSPLITVAALSARYLPSSNTPWVMAGVLETMITARYIFTKYRKNIQVSTSFRLLRSVTMEMSSQHKTAVMMSPAMGIITVSDKLWIMEKIPLFHSCGV